MNDPPGGDPPQGVPENPRQGVISDAESSKNLQQEEEGEEKQENQPQQQHAPPVHPPPPPPHPPLNQPLLPPLAPQHHHSAIAMAQFYEARMRDHAAAYANAAAGAAWAAAQLAAQAADYASGNGPPPPSLDFNSPWNSMDTTAHNNHNQLIYGPPPQPMMMMMGEGDPDPAATVGAYPPPPPPWWHGDPHQQRSVNNMEQLHPQAVARNPRDAKWKQLDSNASDRDDFSGEQQHHQHRRKRQQRLPPADENAPVPRVIAAQPSISQQRGKIRRRLRSDGDSNSSSGSSFMQHSKQNYYRRHSKKKKARSDESLLGKSAVAALYEWCSKRQKKLSFVLQEQASPGIFDFFVYLLEENEAEEDVGDKTELGRGRGRNKGAAKQEAARRALQALAPGVVFDEATGILVGLPKQNDDRRNDNSIRAAASLEDLAPNLEKQLAIGRDNDDGGEEDKADTKKRFKPSSQSQQQSQTKRTLKAYPGTTTTTTSEEEYENYTSRDASVGSVLLHAMVQIDTRIAGPPVYSYEVLPVPAAAVDEPSAEQKQQVKRQTSSNDDKSAVRVPRGCFSCTATLKLRSASDEKAPTEDCASEKEKPTRDDCNVADVGVASLGEHREILKAVGLGGTKREARHVASAKLLALLFPECDTMIEVQAAAEAAREQYAAGKARKQLAASSNFRRRGKIAGDERTHSGENEAPWLGIAASGDPPLPPEVVRELQAIIEKTQQSASSSDELEDCAETIEAKDIITKTTDERPASVFRQLSRQRQLVTLVDKALQSLNDRDEEGRFLPDNLTEDDVGRTVLRRAEPEDLPWIKKLFSAERGKNANHLDSPVSRGSPKANQFSPNSANDNDELASRLWSSSSIVLLLCRAIAAYEDPPLGCALLTLGFSMDRGRILRVAQIASEQHLPHERFVECLQDFAACMKCELEMQSLTESGAMRLNQSNMKSIVESHLMAKEKDVAHHVSEPAVRPEERIKRISSPLQSVQEESEVSDSSAEKRLAKGRTTKPSKRSRFQ